MPCERCLELEERIAWLEGELGVQVKQTQVRVICTAFSITATEAWFALILWKAKGRTVDRYWLLDNRPSAERHPEIGHLNMLRVYMSKLRRSIGPYFKTDWGNGYCITPEGISLINRTLAEGPQGEAHDPGRGRDDQA